MKTKSTTEKTKVVYTVNASIGCYVDDSSNDGYNQHFVGKKIINETIEASSDQEAIDKAREIAKQFFEENKQFAPGTETNAVWEERHFKFELTKTTTLLKIICKRPTEAIPARPAIPARASIPAQLAYLKETVFSK